MKKEFLIEKKEWAKFYKEVFNQNFDFSNIKIPAKKTGFDRLIIVAKGMTHTKAFNKCSELFKTYSYYNELEKIKNDRNANTESYAIWVRDRVEADEENKNKSANDLKKENHTGITFLERIIFEFKYFKETGKHLDIDNWTLCTGSRDSDGDVPFASWDWDGKFKVYWDDPSLSRSDLRSRSAVAF